MSLSPAQRSQTAEDFIRNVTLANLNPEAVRERTGLGDAEFESAYTLTGEVDPVHVWLVRDIIESMVRAAGFVPEPFRHLPERMRPMARLWFGVGDNRYR